MVEPIFWLEDLQVTSGVPVVYDISSAGSGKLVHTHFCQKCGNLALNLLPEQFGPIAVLSGGRIAAGAIAE